MEEVELVVDAGRTMSPCSSTLTEFPPPIVVGV